MDEFTAIQYIGTSLTAVFVGFLTGIFGVGGGFLMTPLLIILLGIKGNIAVGTDLIVIFFNSTIGMVKRRGTATVDKKLALWLAGGGIAGVLIGLYVMSLLKGAATIHILGKEHQLLEITLMALFMVLLVWVALFISFDMKRGVGKTLGKRTGLFDRIMIPPYTHFNSLDEPKTSLIPIIIFGFGTGILTSLMGVGGGVIMLPALIYFVGQHTSKAAGTSLLFVWIVSLFSSIGHFHSGNIRPRLLIGMLIGGFVGTWCGTHIGLKLEGKKIRKYFIFVVIAAVIMVAIDLVIMLFGNASPAVH